MLGVFYFYRKQNLYVLEIVDADLDYISVRTIMPEVPNNLDR
jgi:hypothetical protein